MLSEGVQLCNSDNVFFLFRGERIQIPLKAGHYRPTSETPFKWRLAGVLMAFCWRADDGPTLNAGLVALRILGDPVQYC